MEPKHFAWSSPTGPQELVFTWVPGTSGIPYSFGQGARRKAIHLAGFYIGTTPVTQALWELVIGENPAVHRDPHCPVENISWERITEPGGFLDRINASEALTSVASSDPNLRFRLPTETEWEYAARGGPHWRDDFAFSGSNDPDAVAWYGPRWGRADQTLVRVLGWAAGWRGANRI
jgi:formylglycine-generating enzyme